MTKPIILITMGDPAGIGPEIIIKALSGKRFNSENYQIVVIGDVAILKERMAMLNLKGKISILSDFSDIENNNEIINCIDLKNIDISKFKIGEVQKSCGQASVEYIVKAHELLKKNIAHAMVTCPINKEAINKAGHLFAGHTELLARLTNTKKYAMMLAGEKLRVVLVTTHIALSKVSQNITSDKIKDKIKLTDEFLKKYLLIKNPNIAVCGLNPHNGESGIFGNEEKTKIIPAIVSMQNKKINVSGPYPADALFYQAQHGIFDAVIVMYHDQGLIPLKMLYMDNGINLTLGLPIIRTSVDHGTAFDIAHRGIASENSLISAINFAGKMANNKITNGN